MSLATISPPRWEKQNCRMGWDSPKVKQQVNGTARKRVQKIWPWVLHPKPFLQHRCLWIRCPDPAHQGWILNFWSTLPARWLVTLALQTARCFLALRVCWVTAETTQALSTETTLTQNQGGALAGGKTGTSCAALGLLASAEPRCPPPLEHLVR